MSKKQLFLESFIVIFLILILIGTVHYYLGISKKADLDVLATYELKNNSLKNTIKGAFGEDIVKVKGDILNNNNIGHTIVVRGVPYQACIRYGVTIKNFTYFAINKKIMLETSSLPHRDKIFNECYQKNEDNYLYFYYKD